MKNSPSEHTGKSAIILAGGMGVRLRPFTDAMPKPMLPIGARPLLEINIEYLRREGFDDIVLATGYMKDYISHYFEDGKRFGLRVRYSEEQAPLGTAGAVKLAARGISEAFVVVLGDGLADIDYAGLLEFHRASQAEGTMVVFNQRVSVPYGVLKMETGAGDKILNLEEKPELEFTINTGIVALEPTALDHLGNGEVLGMSDLFRRLKERGRLIVAYRHKGNWIDIGQNVEQYLCNNREIVQGKTVFNCKLTDIIFGGPRANA
ncbi:MAG: NTP transferase domain-containing protein [Chloroflexi bacterium]|nr:NTP transferase domain-containing protein [Chloroflexota bacterium]